MRVTTPATKPLAFPFRSDKSLVLRQNGTQNTDVNSEQLHHHSASGTRGCWYWGWWSTRCRVAALCIIWNRSSRARIRSFCSVSEVDASVFNDDNAGAVLDLLYEAGTQKLYSEVAMAAFRARSRCRPNRCTLIPPR